VHAAWLIEEFSGMDQIIDRLNDLDIHTASLSNTDAEHWKTLRVMNSVSRLQTQILSFETGYRKPDPAIYHAAEDLMDIPGSSILLLDDLRENVEGALRCGWQACLIDPHDSVCDQAREALLAMGVSLGTR
jgi:HAD superfamily hydrolase (TIGR01509 family)